MYPDRNLWRDGSVAVFSNVLLRSTTKMIERAHSVNAIKAWTGCCIEVEGDRRPGDVVGIMKATVLQWSRRRLKVASQKHTLESAPLLDFVWAKSHDYLKFRAMVVVLHIAIQSRS